MTTDADADSVSPRKLEANRRNAQLSTGPKTQGGKRWSRRNSIKHGILASAMLIVDGPGAEDVAAFKRLLADLHKDLAPVGVLEEMMVEKIAVCWWMESRTLRCEAGLIKLRRVPRSKSKLFEGLGLESETEPNATVEPITDHLSLHLGQEMELIFRYRAWAHRDLAYAIKELNRVQQARKEERVPAPLNVNLSAEQ